MLLPSAKASRPWDDGPQSILGVELKLSSEQNVAYLAGGRGAREEFLPCELTVGGAGKDSTSLGHEPTNRGLLHPFCNVGSSPSFATTGDPVRHDLCRPHSCLST